MDRAIIVDNLVKDKKLDTAGLSGRWETFIIQVLENPLPFSIYGIIFAVNDS